MSEPKTVAITLSPRDVQALEYLLPIWNARRTLIRVPPLTPDGLCSEVLQEALWHYVRTFRANEAEHLAAIVHAQPALLEPLRQLVGLPSPPAPPVVMVLSGPRVDSGGQR